MDYKYTLPPTLAARRSTLAAGERVQKRFEQTLDYGSGTADGGRDLGKKFEGMRVYGDQKPTAVRPRSGSDVTPKSRQFQVNLTSYAPSPPESPSIKDSDPLPPYSEKAYPPQVPGQQHHDMYKVNLTDYNPSPVFAAEKPVSRIENDSGDLDGPPKYSKTPPTSPPTTNTYVGEVVTAKVSYSFGLAPPPTSSSYQATPTDSSSSPYPPPTTTASTTFNPNPVSYPPPPQPAQQQYQSYPPTAPPTGKI